MGLTVIAVQTYVAYVYLTDSNGDGRHQEEEGDKLQIC